MTDQPDSREVEVTQADIDLAEWFTRRMSGGNTWTPQVSRLLASHRLAALATTALAPADLPRLDLAKD